MSLFVRLEVSFWTHRKTLRLRSLLGDGALWLPPRLWCYAAQHQPCGDFSDYRPEEIAMLLGWTSNAQAMLEALQQAGFMDGMKLHGWEERNAYHQTFAERAKKAARARWEKTGKRQEKRGEDKEKRQALLDDAKSIASSILKHLNESAGKQFRPTEINLSMICARLKESDVTADGCRAMLDRQVKLWRGTKMEEYLRPQTLFGKEKFGSYYDSRNEPLPTNGTNGKPNLDSIHDKPHSTYGF